MNRERGFKPSSRLESTLNAQDQKHFRVTIN